MKLISLNVARPRLAVYEGTTINTGIFKQPVSGPVQLRTLNLDGDSQADLSVHGGPYKAVYAYPSEHYPFWSQGRLKSVKRFDILARSTKPSLEVFDKVDQNDPAVKKDSLARDPTFGNLLVGKLTQIDLPTNPVDEFPLFFVDNTMEDLWIAVTWGNE